MKNLIATVAMIAFAATAHAQTLSGSFPAEGGAISVTATGGDIAAAGLDFTSASGGLIPAPGTDASPFTFFLANTANQITYGNLGSNVTFAADSTTALSAGASAGTSDIVAAWGMGAVPVAFEVLPAGGVAPAGAAITWSAVNPATSVGDLLGIEGGAITFSPFAYDGGNAAGTFFTGDGGDTGNEDLNTVYNSHGWNGDGASITFEGLTEGDDYMFQLLGAGDTRGCCVGRTQAGDDGMGNVSADFLRGASSVIGSFTAAGATQDVMIIGGTENGVDPGLSGFILADASGAVLGAFNVGATDAGPTVGIPEPTSGCLAMLAGLAGLALRRKR